MKHIKLNTYDLLQSQDFKTALQFEADHAIEFKGGNLPSYFGKQTRRRIVDPINLLSEVEKHQLIHSIFTSKN